MTKYFENWVKRMNKSLVDCDNYRFLADTKTRLIIVTNIKTGKQGIAKCNKSDVFNIAIGRAIAYARCIGKLVPDMDFEPIDKNKKYHLFIYDKRTHKVTVNDYYSYKELKKHGFSEKQQYIENSINNSELKTFIHENSAYRLTVISSK